KSCLFQHRRVKNTTRCRSCFLCPCDTRTTQPAEQNDPAFHKRSPCTSPLEYILAKKNHTVFAQFLHTIRLSSGNLKEKMRVATMKYLLLGIWVLFLMGIPAQAQASLEERGYGVYVPTGYNGQAVPLVIALHGSGDNYNNFARATGLAGVAE